MHRLNMFGGSKEAKDYLDSLEAKLLGKGYKVRVYSQYPYCCVGIYAYPVGVEEVSRRAKAESLGAIEIGYESHFYAYRRLDNDLFKKLAVNIEKVPERNV